MLVHLSSFDVFLWFAIAVTQTLLAALAMWRRLDRKYPAFSTYILFSALKTWVLIAVQSHNDWVYFWLYYACSVTACVLMAVAVGELYRKTFAKRWARVPAWVPRTVKTWLAAAISSCAVLAIALKPLGANKYMVTMGAIQSALVSALLISLVVLVVYSRHLGLTWRPWPQRIAFGFIFCLSVNGPTMYMLGLTSRETAEVVRRIGQMAYFVSLLWWGCTLWARETVPEKATTEQIAEMVSAHRQTLAVAGQLTEV